MLVEDSMKGYTKKYVPDLKAFQIETTGFKMLWLRISLPFSLILSLAVLSV